MSDFSSNIKSFSDNINEVSVKINDLDIKADDLENTRSRRNNLCFDGIPENVNETWQDTEGKLKEILSTKLELEMDSCAIERAHRVGQMRSSKPRTIVAKFSNYKTRNAVLNLKKQLKGTSIFIREDYSDKVQAKRRELIPRMIEARNNGMVAFLRYDKLITHPRSSRSAESNPEIDNAVQSG